MEKHKPFSEGLNSLEGKNVFDSRIENIDAAMYNFINEHMNLHAHTNNGFKKVPVIMATAERAHQSKRDYRVRDDDGSLIMPLITIERTSMTKSPSEKGTVWANVPPLSKLKGGSIPVAKKILQSKTSNFANADAYDLGTYPKASACDIIELLNCEVFKKLSLRAKLVINPLKCVLYANTSRILFKPEASKS